MYTMSAGPFTTWELKLKLKALHKLVESGMLPHRGALAKMNRVASVKAVIAKRGTATEHALLPG